MEYSRMTWTRIKTYRTTKTSWSKWGFIINVERAVCRHFIPGGPPKNGTVDFSGLCSDQQFFFPPCWIEHLFLIYNNTKIIKFGWELFILWVISYGLSFSGFARFPEFRGTINEKLMAKSQKMTVWYLRNLLKNKKFSTKFDDLGVIIMRKRSSIQQGEKG